MNHYTSSRKLLVVGYVWPEPCSSAAGLHMMSLLKVFLSTGWEVHFSSPSAIGEHQIDLASEGIQAHEIALNCSSFDDFVEALSPQVVLFDRYMMEEQFSWRVAKACPQAMRVLDMEDFHALRHARHQAVKQGRELSNVDLVSDLSKREVASIFRCDLSLVISDFELELLADRFQVPKRLMHHCPFMLEPQEDIDGCPSFENRTGFVSIGNFRHAPNWDAVLRLRQEIWPLIRAELPKAQLNVYGAYPPAKAMQLHSETEGFLVKGWADDAREVMRQARVCLAPLRFGAGIKGKLTEAMLCGTPSVTTSIGVEGMQGDCEWPGIVANDAEAFAKAAVHLHEDADLWTQKQSCASVLLRQRFDREAIAQSLIQRVELTLAELENHRTDNFIGSMLWHHSLKSTQYMSQWIEVKNAR